MEQEIKFCALRSKNIIDIIFLELDLHEEPEKLNKQLRKALECTCDADGNLYDATLLGYGLCSNAIVGLSAKIPVVVPRGHDCITLLLGSKEKYRQYFDSHRGIYWYSPGWIKSGRQPSKERYEEILKVYTEKYGPDNAEHLMRTEQDWIKEYTWATYVDWGFEGSKEQKQFTRSCAEFLKLKYDELKGDPSLMQRFLDGEWSDEEFLIVKPGQKIEEDLTSDGIIKSE